MKTREIIPADDPVLAGIIRDNLKAHALDIPGTVYFDDNLNHLSDFYRAGGKNRFYYILLNDADEIIGGVGLAEFEPFEDCAELQKLYLTDSTKGHGLGYELIRLIEKKAKELGYKRMYLETHDNLQAAIHEYVKSGFYEIEKPEAVVHATMNRFFLKELS